jgi:GNAT superfamily N-acetyltransferase
MNEEFIAILIRPMSEMDLDSVRGLSFTAASEGFKFLERFIQEFEQGSIRLNQFGEFFLCVEIKGRLVGVGGVTPDPYLDQNQIGRVRHVYVDPEWRGMGVGSKLLGEIEHRAKRTYASLRLRTDTDAAARFYESNGYRAVRSSTSTHERSW